MVVAIDSRAENAALQLAESAGKAAADFDRDLPDQVASSPATGGCALTRDTVLQMVQPIYNRSTAFHEDIQ